MRRPDGRLVWDLTSSQMADLVDGYLGAGTVDRSEGIGSAFIAAILGGQYLGMGFSAQRDSASFWGWFAILRPVTSDSPAVLGVVRYNRGTTGVPYLGLAGC